MSLELIDMLYQADGSKSDGLRLAWVTVSCQFASVSKHTESETKVYSLDSNMPYPLDLLFHRPNKLNLFWKF